MSGNGGGDRRLSADDVVEAAARIVDGDGARALTMRRLSDDLGVAVTSIYWHVGNREALIGALVDRLITEMGTLTPAGESPVDRIASLAHGLRSKLIERRQVVALAHEQAKTALVFRPVQVAIATELAALNVRGADAALVLRALQMHVVAEVLLEGTLERNPGGTVRPPADDWPEGLDDELLAELGEEPDRLALFDYGLRALLVALPSTVP